MPPAATNLAIDPAARAERDLAAYLAADRAKPLLRFVTCGSVDDGKSTLIGRLLYDSKRLFQDQLATLENDSRRFGTQGQKLDFALLVDGLSAEREQGITIDVAYRFFASDTRKFIVADAPGHEQYTRNMATAASTADLAVILIDATEGVLPQTRRHSHIVRLLGVRSIVLAVNKMDLVGYDQARFDAIVADYAAFAAEAGIGDFTAIPLAAVTGENLTRRSENTPWYAGPTLTEALEAAPTAATAGTGAFAMPVQWVSRPDRSFRGFAGTIARGMVRPGDPVQVLPGGRASRIARIVTFDGDLTEAAAGQAVTLVLTDEVESAAGSTIAAPGEGLATGSAIKADLVWLDERALTVGRSYLLQAGAQQVPARVEAVEAVLPIAGAATATGMTMNAIGAVRIVTDAPIAAASYDDSRALGAFILIDRESHGTVGAGMIRTLTGDTGGRRRTDAPIYAMADQDEAAEALVRRLRAADRPAAVLNEAALRAGVAADLADSDVLPLWRRAVATARLLAESGVTVALTLPPPDGTDAIGDPPPSDPTPDWVI